MNSVIKTNIISSILNGGQTINIPFNNRIVVFGMYGQGNGFAYMAYPGTIFKLVSSNNEVVPSCSGNTLTLKNNNPNGGYRLLVITI